MMKKQYRQGQLFDSQPVSGIERRYFQSKVETRADENSAFNFSGLASRTGVEYEMYSDDSEVWVEEIAPGAFDEVLNNDVRVLINHDNNLILGRTSAGTARVFRTDDGLSYEWQNDDNISYAKDLGISIRRGDINQSSFGFSTEHKNNTFEKLTSEDGRTKYKRTINKIDALYDVSPVTFPASDSTEVGKRDFENAISNFKQEIEQREAQQQKEEQRKQTNAFYQMELLAILNKRRSVCL